MGREQANAPVIVTVRFLRSLAFFDNFQEDLFSEAEPGPWNKLSGIETFNDKVLSQRARRNGETRPPFDIGDVFETEKAQGPAGMVSVRITDDTSVKSDNGLLQGNFRFLAFFAGTNGNQSAHK